MDWRHGGKGNINEEKVEGEEDQKPGAESTEIKKGQVTTPRT